MTAQSAPQGLDRVLRAAILPRRCILCCDTSITRSWHGQCVSSSALKATKPWRAVFWNGSLTKERPDIFVDWQNGMVGVFAWERSEARVSRSVLREAGREFHRPTQRTRTEVVRHIGRCGYKLAMMMRSFRTS
jgi:hypothetical protein